MGERMGCGQSLLENSSLAGVKREDIDESDSRMEPSMQDDSKSDDVHRSESKMEPSEQGGLARLEVKRSRILEDLTNKVREPTWNEVCAQGLAELPRFRGTALGRDCYRFEISEDALPSDSEQDSESLESVSSSSLKPFHYSLECSNTSNIDSEQSLGTSKLNKMHKLAAFLGKDRNVSNENFYGSQYGYYPKSSKMYCGGKVEGKVYRLGLGAISRMVNEKSSQLLRSPWKWYDCTAEQKGKDDSVQVPSEGPSDKCKEPPKGEESKESECTQQIDCSTQTVNCLPSRPRSAPQCERSTWPPEGCANCEPVVPVRRCPSYIPCRCPKILYEPTLHTCQRGPWDYGSCTITTRPRKDKSKCDSSRSIQTAEKGTTFEPELAKCKTTPECEPHKLLPCPQTKGIDVCCYDELPSGWKYWLEYLIVFALFFILLVIIVILLVLWCTCHRTGFGFWLEDQHKQFNLHAILMISGTLLSATAIIVYRLNRSSDEVYMRLIHGGIHFAAVLCLFMGMIAGMTFDFMIGLAHFVSVHSWIGLSTIIIYFFQFFLGMFSYLCMLCCRETTKHFRFWFLLIHKILGLTIFLFTIASCLTGIMEKSYLNEANHEITRRELTLMNAIGFCLFALGLLVAYLLSREMFKVKTEEEYATDDKPRMRLTRKQRKMRNLSIKLEKLKKRCLEENV